MRGAFDPRALDHDGVRARIEEVGLAKMVEGNFFSVDLDDIRASKAG